MTEKNLENLANLFYEIGNLRKINRAHQQTLLANDPSDNIASHSFRTAFIGYFLAKSLQADSDKVLKMCLMHDLAEARSGDMNWVNKKYVKVFEDEIINDQLGQIPHNQELLNLMKEYEKRKSKEAKIAKDADLIDQTLLIKEYVQQGNQEARRWLHEDDLDNSPHIKLMHFQESKDLAKKISKKRPSDWWKNIWTSKNR